MSKDALAQLLPHIIELKENMARIEERVSDIPQRIDTLERDLNGAKLLGRVALGVTAAMGAFVTWAVDLYTKLPHWKA